MLRTADRSSCPEHGGLGTLTIQSANGRRNVGLQRWHRPCDDRKTNLSLLSRNVSAYVHCPGHSATASGLPRAHICGSQGDPQQPPGGDSLYRTVSGFSPPQISFAVSCVLRPAGTPEELLHHGARTATLNHQTPRVTEIWIGEDFSMRRLVSPVAGHGRSCDDFRKVPRVASAPEETGSSGGLRKSPDASFRRYQHE